ncbi:MAG: hypothetical protein CSA03_00990 [Bacteroidetes bacterium]|nr:MAG: hypothetical protein CSA03_00990 [Bacteroidota bacterium]
MKHFFLACLLTACTINTQAQNFEPVELHDSIFSKYFKQILYLDNYCIHPDYDYAVEDDDVEIGFMQMHRQNFTFYANKHDTLAIFDAKLCGGHEAGVVNVYSVEKGIPSILISRSGKISALQNDTIWIYTYPCCASFLNIITPFSLQTGKQLGESHVFYSRKDIAWVSPVKTVPNKNYVAKNSATLHLSPSLSDQIDLPICTQWSNQIGKLKEDQSFTLIEVLSNNWVLIRLDGMKTNEGFCFSDYYTKLIGRDNYTLYAWILAEDIEWE